MLRSLLLLALWSTSLACSSGPTPPTPSDVVAPPAEAERSASGLAWRVLAPGTGSEHPSRRSTTDGELFDSSVRRGSPSTFRLDQVIRGWTEGVQLMVVGEQRRFWIPEALAYQGVEGRPQGMLVFDVELLAIEPEPAP